MKLNIKYEIKYKIRKLDIKFEISHGKYKKRLNRKY